MQRKAGFEGVSVSQTKLSTVTDVLALKRGIGVGYRPCKRGSTSRGVAAADSPLGKDGRTKVSPCGAPNVRRRNSPEDSGGKVTKAKKNAQ